MDRNIIITGGAGNLGRVVVEKFKREGFKVIAIIMPGSGDVIQEADDVYEVDVTNETSVGDFAKEYLMQYGKVESLALLVGGYQGGKIEDTPVAQLLEMINLNFLSAYNMVKAFLPLMKKENRGSFLLVSARTALQADQGKFSVAYSLSKGLINHLANLISQDVAGTSIRAHVFVPSIIDTPQNREGMKDADFSRWIHPAEIAETMHYAAINPSLRNMIFKLYGEI